MAKQKKIKVSDLFPDSENVNLGTERGRAMLERSLRQYGAGRSILLDKNRKIIAGNKTTEVAGEIGLEDVIVVETTGHELVAVVRTDLDLDKDPAARELAYADNRVAELDLSYDAEQVARDVAKGIDIGFFFSEGELNQIIDEINRVGEPPPEPDAIERLDKAEQIQLEWGTEPGQLWEAGPHRLLVGDSTDQANWERVFQGGYARMIWTDPPYGVDYEGRTKDALTMENDTAEGLEELLRRVFDLIDTYLVEGGPIYVAHPAGPLQVLFGECFVDAGWHLHQSIVWVKNVMVMGRSDYHYQHEPILYGWKKGKKRPWYGRRRQVSTHFVDRPMRSEKHPVVKPAELIETHIVNSTVPGEIVFDPFLGSGSTIVAAVRQDRIGYGIELEPKYAAVSLDRLREMGLEPIKTGS